MSRRKWMLPAVLGLAGLGPGALVFMLAGAGGRGPCGRTDSFAELGWTPLVRAARTGEAAVVEQLARDRAALERRDRARGWTPLLHAVHRRRPAAVRALAAAGADLEARSDDGTTPLLMAASGGDRRVVEELLAAGADPHALGPYGQTMLVAAALSGDPAIEEQLLRAAPDLRQRSNPLALWTARGLGRVHAAVWRWDGR